MAQTKQKAFSAAQVIDLDRIALDPILFAAKRLLAACDHYKMIPDRDTHFDLIAALCHFSDSLKPATGTHTRSSIVERQTGIRLLHAVDHQLSELHAKCMIMRDGAPRRTGTLVIPDDLITRLQCGIAKLELIRKTHTESAGAALDEKGQCLLEELAQNKDILHTEVALEAAGFGTRKTIGIVLGEFEKRGLIHYPKGKRKGCAVTTRGAHLWKQIGKTV